MSVLALDRANGVLPLGGRWIAITIFVVVLLVYALGFLSLGRSVGTAFSIAFAHVAPAAVAAAAAWWLQPYLRRIATRRLRWIAHVGLALLFGIAWAGGLALITLVFSPDALPHLVDEILYWTAVTGTLAYTAVAAVAGAVSLRRRALEREAAAALAELAALRARVEPHFLYNALESIAGLVRSDPDAAEDAIARLGSALRRLLDGRNDADPDRLVPLADELANVRDTLFIERLRMGKRLKVVECIADEALDCLVPPLTLQPLVENAVQHGLSGKIDGGTVSIAARVEGGARLVLEVADDGAVPTRRTSRTRRG